MGMPRDIFFVGYQNDGIAQGMNRGKKFHDLDGCLGIQVAGGLIGQNQGRSIDQCTGHRNALSLAPG